MNKFKVLFRTNGGASIGFGHLMRCITLAKVLDNYNIKSIFLTNHETKNIVVDNGFEFIDSEKFNDKDLLKIKDFNPDCVVFDSYLATIKYLNELSRQFNLVQFDDNNDVYGSISANILINGNLHAKNLDYYCSEKTKLLLGPNYLVMKEEYWQNNEVDIEKNGVLLTTGGADLHNLMPKLVDSIKSLNCTKRIIIGPAFSEKQIQRLQNITNDNSNFKLIFKPKSLKKYINSSSLVITASGSTVYEALRLKTIPVVFTLANNQKKIANELQKHGVKNLGWFKEINYDSIPKTVEEILSNRSYYEDKLESIFSKFDGKGALRVAKKIIDEVKTV